MKYCECGEELDKDCQGRLRCPNCDEPCPDCCDSAPDNACECGGEYQRSKYCGVKVCDECGDHLGLERCYCGWSASGGDGLAELEEMGECIDEDY